MLEFLKENMFKKARNREIPSSAKDCTKEDPVSSNLWTWATRLETVAIVLFWFNAVIGVISGIVWLFNSLFEYHNFLMGLGTFLLCTVGGIVLSIIAYISWHIFALLVGTAANISHNTRIMSEFMILDHGRNNVGAATAQTWGEEGASPLKQTTAAPKQQQEANASTPGPAESAEGDPWRHIPQDLNVEVGEEILHPEFGTGTVVSAHPKGLNVRFGPDNTRLIGWNFIYTQCKSKNSSPFEEMTRQYIPGRLLEPGETIKPGDRFVHPELGSAQVVSDLGDIVVAKLKNGEEKRMNTDYVRRYCRFTSKEDPYYFD